MTLGLSPEGTEKHLESRMATWGWEAISRLFLSLVPGRHTEITWVSVLEAEKQGYKNIKC